MKTATDSSVPGQTVQTTVTRRIIPVDSSTSERKTPDFWDYIEKLPADWDRHILYLYRRTSDTGPLIPLEKCAGYMTMPDNTQVALNNREEVEFAVARKFGGGTYRLILKRGSERVTEGRIMVEGPPKAVAPPIFEQGSAPQITPMNENGGIAQVATRAMDTIANSEQRAVAIGMDALTTAANVVKNFSQQQNSASDDMLKQAMAVMLQRALTPVDPMASLTQMLALFQQLNAVNNPAGATNPVLGRIMDAAVEKILNPAPTGPISSAGAELVRQLPSVASYITDAIREWRIGSEAQRDTAAMMRGTPPPQPGQQPQRPAPQTVLPPVQQPNPQPQPVNPMGAPTLEFVESKIVEILKEPLSAQEAADETIAFLDRMDPTLIKQLAQVGEPGLVQLFQARPVLKQATQNMPRLLEFIKAFMKYASESEAKNEAAQKPN